LTVTAALVAAAAADVGDARAAHPRYAVTIQAVFDQDGNPALVANFSPNGSLATPSWTICPPAGQGACRTMRTAHATIQPGPEPPGTRFTSTATYRGHTYTSAVTWHGQVHALGRPGLAGSARLNGRVTPIAARWAGGWGNELDQLGVEACRTTTAHSCWMLGGGEVGCPDNTSRPRLEGWFTGYYLFALDSRTSRDIICAGTGYARNAGLPLWKLGPTIVRSRALARIAGPPRPTVRILHEAVVRRGMVVLAKLDCPARCPVELGQSTGQVWTGSFECISSR
jgi:hypothetical protein